MSYQEKIETILNWVEDEGYDKGFDPSFVEKLKKQMQRTGSLSPSQEIAVDNIIKKWEIE